MTDTSSDLQKYGVPFYGAGWVPYNHIKSKLASQEKIEEDKKEEKDPSPSNDDEITTPLNYVVLAGGGGEGRSGIPNAIVVSHVNFTSKSLSDQPVSRFRGFQFRNYWSIFRSLVDDSRSMKSRSCSSLILN